MVNRPLKAQIEVPLLLTLVHCLEQVRMHLARKRHAPRYKGVLRLKKLQNQIEEIGVMGGKLKGGKESIKANVDKIYTQLDAAIAKIKSSERISSREIDMMHSSLVAAIQVRYMQLSRQSMMHAKL